MSFADIERLLAETIGLDVSSMGTEAIRRAVRRRQAACSLPGPEAYLRYLGTSEAEMQELIEAVIVPETWFFRDRSAFELLVRTVQEEWLPVRILSLPCASGEEPYSVAMALLDAGISPERFSIHAVDISQHALERARQALYTRNSFRGADLLFQQKHFTETPRGFALESAISRHVQFQYGNLLSAEGLWLAAAPYHAVFCRNLLIYFDSATQIRAVAMLKSVLKDDGVLFVGSGEAGLMLSQGFTPINAPLAFAFRKSGVSSPAATVPQGSGPQRLPASTHRVPGALQPLLAPSPVKAAAAVTGPPISAAAAELDAAARLADQGRLAEAEAACKEYLRAHEPSARVYVLMGLLCDAAGNYEEAIRHYRKALYLDPNHREALTHLAAALEKCGENDRAQVLRQRAGRQTENNTSK